LSGTSSSIRTKLWWNSHWMVLFQNCVRQSRSPTKMATTVQLRCYWKQLWSRWAITGSWEPLVLYMSCFLKTYEHSNMFIDNVSRPVILYNRTRGGNKNTEKKKKHWNVMGFYYLWNHPGFKWGSCYSIFSFMCMFCRCCLCIVGFVLLNL
jgi:hypothetical protein